MAGVSSLAGQKQFYGVFPLRGKLLNCREAGHVQISGNEEIKNIVKAMGFDFKRKYSEPSDLDQLRYGKLMIMTDQARIISTFAFFFKKSFHEMFRLLFWHFQVIIVQLVRR